MTRSIEKFKQSARKYNNSSFKPQNDVAKIDYSLIEVLPNVFAIIVPNQKHRALLFIRVQEYYESPNPKYKRKIFDVEKYMEWYNCSKYAGIKCDEFAYINDWPGFNIPYDIARECYDKLHNKRYKNLVTMYDRLFIEILKDIEKLKSQGKAYIMGTNSIRSDTFYHEMRHAMYYMDDKYKHNIDTLIDMIPKDIYKKYSKNLRAMGYESSVIRDELQTYIGTNDWDFPQLIKGIPKDVARDLHYIFLSVFKYYVLHSLKIDRRHINSL